MKQQPPIVSVGMPVYNGGTDLRDGIESILDQSFADLELVVCDNASSDDTELIAREYANRDERVRYFRNRRNIGAPGNYNAVFRLARGRYFKWASANDICRRGFIERCVDALNDDSNVVLSYPKTRLFDKESGHVVDFEDNLDLRFGCPVRRFAECVSRIRLNNALNGVFRTDALKRTALIQSFMGSDMTLMAEMALLGKFVEVPEFLFYRRVDSGAIAAQKGEKGLLAHYYPGRRRPMLFQSWRILVEYYAIAWRSPLVPTQKMRLFGHLFKRIYWSAPKLADDLHDMAKRAFCALPRLKRW